MIHVIQSGVLTTIQDLGRTGFAHLGLSPAGAADSVSYRIANLLVGNVGNAPALEITLLGPTLEFETSTMIAISGSRTSTSLPLNEPFEVAAGTRISVGSLVDGARTYLAVRGGIAVPEVMNSSSTFIPAKIGGLQGRPLKAGNRLAVGKQVAGSDLKLPLGLGVILPLMREASVRVTLSLQSDWFDHGALERFQLQAFTVTDESNRSGLRLHGEPILPANQGELLTEGVALGAIQVPPDGQPIILFVDQQTTGGYPKIANVIAADLPRIGQLRPRDPVRFQVVTIADAVEWLRRQEHALRQAFGL
jgi:antagonist of KipI